MSHYDIHETRNLAPNYYALALSICMNMTCKQALIAMGFGVEKTKTPTVPPRAEKPDDSSSGIF